MYCYPPSVSLNSCHTKPKQTSYTSNMFRVTVPLGHYDYPGFQLDIPWLTEFAPTPSC